MTAIRVATAMLLAIGCAAEPIETSPCEEASATLERCTGQVPEGFAAACASDPDQVASAVLAEQDATSCTDADGKADGIAKTEFVGSCTALVNAAYWIVWLNSPTSKPLPAAAREKLRPWYGDLVDTVRVSWNSGLLTHWRVFGREVILEDDTAAQTFGNEIFIRESPTYSNAQLALIGHELDHAAQYRARGSVTGFARAYCSAFFDSGFSYRQNALEVEAYDRQYAIRQCLDRGIGCP